MTGESVLNPAKYVSNNVLGTLGILEAMRDTRTEYIVVSRTCAVHGEPEQMLADCEVAHGLHWTSLRYFNNVGCDADGDVGERHEPKTHLIPNILRAIKGEIPALTLFGDDYPTPDGTCIRDDVHVSDFACATYLPCRS